MSKIKELVTELEKNGYNYEKTRELHDMSYNNIKEIGEENMRWLKEEAEKNNSYAQNTLANMYLNTLRERTEAIKWYKMSAEQGNPEGQYNYGHMYDMYIENGEKYEEKYKWYKKSAEQGNITAQAELGEMFFKGNGVERNLFEALKWFTECNNKAFDYDYEIREIKNEIFDIVYEENKELKKEKSNYIIKIMSEHIILDLARIIGDFCL